MDQVTNKTIRIKEAAKWLGITVNQLHTFIAQSIPKELLPRKTHHNVSGNPAYEFTSQDLEIFKRAVQLKRNLSYSKVKTQLREEILERGENMPLQHLYDFFSEENNPEPKTEVQVEMEPSAKLINIKSKQEQLLVSSREIAENFEKEHKNVLRDIDNLKSDSSKLSSDFFIEHEYTNKRGQTYKEYLLTRDGFSLLAMGFTGNKALQWKLKYIEAFNKMEQKLKSRMIVKESYMINDPIERAKAWILEQQEVETLKLTTTKQEQIIGELKPSADYTDIILQSKDLITITQISKDYGMSGQAMNKLLFDLGVQYKQSGQWLLYREHQGKGYTHSETTQYIKFNGEVGSNMLTKWTQKGRLFLYELLKEEKVLPEIEQH